MKWFLKRHNKTLCLQLLLGISLLVGFSVSPFASSTSIKSSSAQNDSTETLRPNRVDINPSVEDKAISHRIQTILKATSWFEAPSVKVNSGVVYLSGATNTQKHKLWAEQLAYQTQHVVAVVNEIKVVGDTSWYMQEIVHSVHEQWQRFLRALPYLGISLFILMVFWMVSRLFSSSTQKTLVARNVHPLLADVIGRGIAILCFLVGFYVVLQILGLTTIAITVLGGTGILGIILGIAFRDITENVLASVLLSIQKPFQKEDLIEVDGVTGYVQGLTIRATMIITLDGHQVQIPNAIVYKNNIYNFTSNPKRRESFVVGIGYEGAISHAQDIALKVLEEHPAVLGDPEPWILVEELAPETVNLRVFFWLNSEEFHWRKVKSSVMRLVKRAFQNANISMPGRRFEVEFV